MQEHSMAGKLPKHRQSHRHQSGHCSAAYVVGHPETAQYLLSALLSILPLMQVDEMEKAVDVAEKNMSRFGLLQAEISNRRKWVMQTRKKVRLLTNKPVLHHARCPTRVPLLRLVCQSHQRQHRLSCGTMQAQVLQLYCG